MKNTRKILTLILSLCLLLTGCKSKSKHMTNLLQAGTYEVTVDGYDGPLTLGVTLASDHIENITVVGENETQGIGKQSIQMTIDEILKNQSLNVDTVTGATVTSEAVISGVQQAIEKALGDPSQWQKEAEKSSQYVEDVNTQVVVIGGGISGISATLRLRQLGYQVVLIEKQDHLGGSFTYGNAEMIVTGSQNQDELVNRLDSSDKLAQDLMKLASNSTDVSLVQAFAKNVDDTVEWVQEDLGLEFASSKYMISTEEYSVDRVLPFYETPSKMVDFLNEAVYVSKAKVYYSTRAISLQKDTTKKYMVVALDQNQNTYRFHANHVVLATGGYGANLALSKVDPNLKFSGNEYQSGDGIILVSNDDMQGQVKNLDEVEYRYDSVMVDEKKYISDHDAIQQALPYGAILINQQGNRFTNEADSQRAILANQKLQENGVSYVLMNQDAFDVYREVLKKRYGQQVVDGISAKTSTSYVQAETLEEVAKLAYIDETALLQTVKEYDNKIQGYQLDLYNRPKTSMKRKIQDGSYYYLVKQEIGYHQTLGGIYTTAKLQVLDQNNQAIDGLYAIGDAVGNFYGSQLGRAQGTSWAFVSGKMVADYISSLDE